MFVTGLGGEELVLPLGRVQLVSKAPAPAADTNRAEQLRRRVAAIRGNGSRNGSELRVAAFTHDLDIGGAQRFFFDQVQRLAEDPGISCTAVAPADGPWRDELEDAGVAVHVTTGYPTASADQYEGKVAELAAWMAGMEFDVAFVNTLDAFIGADAAQRIGLPTVWAIHESFDLDVWWFGVHGPQRKRAYARDRAHSALSSASLLIFGAEATSSMYSVFAPAERRIVLP